MIKLQGKLPRDLYIAVSGGVDSMVALDFLSRNHNVTVLHVNHGTEHSEEAQHFVSQYCSDNDIKIISHKLFYKKPADLSWEEHWRNKRYEAFERYDYPVVTAHHLNDCAETWLWGTMNGQPRLPCYRYKNAVRPFLLNSKNKLKAWAHRHDVPYIEDNSNNNVQFTRNRIRHNIMPEVLKVNPGFMKVVAKKVRENYDNIK